MALRRIGWFACMLLALASAFAAGETLDLKLHVQGLGRAAPPEKFGPYLIFTYAAPGHAYIVGARFSHERYGVFHTFRKNDNNVFVLVLDAPEESQVLKYRLMVDSVWMADPANPVAERDEQGVLFSLFAYEKTGDAPVESPRFLPDGYIEFSLETRSGAIVSIAGDFNAFDPFTHRLSERSPGLFSIRLRLLPGRHFYYFIVDGTAQVDPQNQDTVVDSDRRHLSLVVVR